jgi:site-specific DNA recombinase
VIAAIYARKSTDQSGIADDQKSVARQVEHARAYAVAKGCRVADEHVYVDDGISGAEFANRPGFLRLMNALKPRAPFQVLVMSEESRLGREAIETAYALKQLVTAGVRVFFYLEDRERTLDSPTDKIMLSLTAFADELEREKARQRTYDAMLRKARAGHVTGGRVFGYDNVRKDTGGVVRVVNDREAAIVREIFDRCSRGQGLRTIARSLNDAGAACPRSQQGRPAGWCPSSVREALYRPLYRGEIVWNRTRKRNTWGQKQQHGRPAADWVNVAAPQLRIVPDDAWKAAHDRLSASRETYLRTNRGVLWGKPTNGIDSKYLLSGLARCGVCGGGLYVASRSHGRQRAYFYACTAFHRKGQSICGNNSQVVMAEADAEVLQAVQDELLDPVVVTYALRVAVAELTSTPEGVSDRIAALRARVQVLDGEIDRFTAAIGVGGELTSLVNALKQREQDRRRVVDEVTQLETVEKAGPVSVDALEQDLVARVEEWRAMAARNVTIARQLLRKLLRGRVVLTPREDGTCELSGQADYGKLFSGIPLATALASPTGTERCCGPAFRRILTAA